MRYVAKSSTPISIVFKEYLGKVEKVNYALEVPADFDIDSAPPVRLQRRDDSSITDKSNEMIGATFTVMRGGTRLGQLTLLPSLVPNANEKMIDSVISGLRGHVPESPPTWMDDLRITGMDKIKSEIAGFESQKKGIDTEISGLKSKQRELYKYGELLYSSGNQLEASVKAAFILLGFNEINKARGPSNEDWQIELRSVPDVAFGVLEVKGRMEKTKRQDIVQCNTWVDDYFTMTPLTKSKGIFIPNQFRLNPFPQSKIRRKCFEPNELEYAKTRKICIIPTYVLFEAVNKVLGGQSPARSDIEQKFFNTNGILESIF